MVHEHAPGHTAVCAYSDGQHLSKDPLAVSAEVGRRFVHGNPDAIVLGVRGVDRQAPLRSRVGKRAMMALVALTSLGVPITVAGITTDATLWTASFGVLCVYVFTRKHPALRARAEEGLQVVGGPASMSRSGPTTH